MLRQLLCVPIALVFVALLTAGAQSSHQQPADDSATTAVTRQTPTTAATPAEEAPRGDGLPANETPTSGPPQRQTPPSDAPTSAPPTSDTPNTTDSPTTSGAPATSIAPGSSEVPAADPGAGQPDQEAPAPDQSVNRPGRPAQVQSSEIPIGSILFAVLVLLVIGLVARRLMRRPSNAPDADDLPSRGTDTANDANPATLDVETLDLLLGLGRVLITSGVAVSMVESTLKRVAVRYGIDDLGAIVFSTSLILSIPAHGEVHTEAASADAAPLRLDQLDEVTNLVRNLSHTSMTVEDAQAELLRIQRSTPPFTPRVRVVGYWLTTTGLVLILNGTWKELLVGGALGVLVGLALVATRDLTDPWYLPFQPLVAALASSIAAFAAAHLIDGFSVIPALVAPLVTMLPGAKLTMGVVELVTGHLVAGTSRVASGMMQLVLLALGIVAGAQLVGIQAGGFNSGENASILGMLAPWFGVAVYGVGIVWFNGALRSSRWWMLAVLYVAYAGQVLGALFFGAALSSFFGAVVMTPFAVLASRQPSGASPLVTFLPAFWMLVPGALGLQGASMLLGPLGANGADTLITTLTSMVGISLGVLLGLALVDRDQGRAWLGDTMPAPDTSSTAPAPATERA